MMKSSEEKKKKKKKKEESIPFYIRAVNKFTQVDFHN